MKLKVICLLLFPLAVLNSAAQTWNALGSGASNTVFTLCFDSARNTLYAGGKFIAMNGQQIKYAAKWDGTAWSGFGSGVDATVNVIHEANGKVYLGGDFVYAGDSMLNCFGEWNGAAFIPYGSGFFKTGGHSVTATINAIALYKGSVYAGGIFDEASGDPVKYIARWNGTKWEAVGGNLEGISGVEAMVVYKDELYVGGGFYTAGGTEVKYIARWDGNIWKTVGNGMSHTVMALEVYKDELYAGGIFTAAGSIAANYIAKWDGNTWKAVGGGTNNIVYALHRNKWIDRLEVGGAFTLAGNLAANNHAYWNNNIWNGVTVLNNRVWSLSSNSTGSFIGGEFTAPSTRIGMRAYPTGDNELPNDSRLSVYPNPAANTLNINKVASGSARIKIWGPFGQLLVETEPEPGDSKIDVSTLDAGLYYIEINTNKYRHFEKLLIVK